jgi:predicted alpha/beta-hydrolase family hydrolase
MTNDILWNGPPTAALTIVLAHGAGAPMDSPFMNDMAERLSALGHRIARFEFPYMAKRRIDGKKRPPDRAPVLIDTYRAVIQHIGMPEKLVIGGKSMGGRIASMIADDENVKALLCLGYPFHPTGKPEKLRVAHLQTLKTPALMCHGTRDPFGTPDEVATYGLSPALSMYWVADGNHDFTPRKASGRDMAQNLADCGLAIHAFLQTPALSRT